MSTNKINYNVLQSIIESLPEFYLILVYAQELQKMNQNLRIAQEQAQLLVKEAEAENRAKSLFLAKMSHEIRTSLNGVIGMTELLLDTKLSAQQLEFSETIRVSGEALLNVINDVLDYSKIESGHLQLHNSDFDLQLLLDQTVEIVIGQAYRKRIEIGSFVEPDVPEFCYGDACRIRQILNNLITNAVKFTKKGEISIWIKLLKREEAHLTLLIEISDTGVGMDKATINRLFNPYMQASPSIAMKYGGSGLGLCISKQLIELMGGNITVESEPSVGSTFTFTLQLKESRNQGVPYFKTYPEFKHARVLCVDDSPINQKMISHLLTSWGIQCDVANNSTKAIAMLVSAQESKQPYTLMLIDDCMPTMNGIELIKIIRQLKEVAKTPVILLLSLGFPFHQEEFENLDIYHSISKPIHPKKLYDDLVAVILKKQKLTVERAVSRNENNKQFHGHVLLAEDNFINQQICLGIMTKFGLAVDVVSSGLEAIQAHKANHYDLILMDCQMPEMDGYHATMKIRKIEEGKGVHIPIIAMTAHALRGDREKCIEAGMDDYVSKPIIVKKLNEVLSRWLVDRKSKA